MVVIRTSTLLDIIANLPFFKIQWPFEVHTITYSTFPQNSFLFQTIILSLAVTKQYQITRIIKTGTLQLGTEILNSILNRNNFDEV